MGAYRGEWPVNRIAQGTDVPSRTPVEGLYLVGDAVKPSGYLMVEGVAQSVNLFLDTLDRTEYNGTKLNRASNIITPPSRLKAIRWLWEAPGNARKT